MQGKSTQVHIYFYGSLPVLPYTDTSFYGPQPGVIGSGIRANRAPQRIYFGLRLSRQRGAYRMTTKHKDLNTTMCRSTHEDSLIPRCSHSLRHQCTCRWRWGLRQTRPRTKGARVRGCRRLGSRTQAHDRRGSPLVPVNVVRVTV